MEIPVFRLASIGFNDREERQLRATVAKDRQVHWQPWRAERADAWLINGARAARIDGTLVRFIASEATSGGPAILLDVSSRPTAVATPAPALLQQLVAHSFELRRMETLSTCLRALESDLAPLKRMYWVASHLVKITATVGQAVYELRAGSQVLAIADMKGTVSVSPDASEKQLEQAAWSHRARKMVDVPAAFEQHTLSELLWTYATRTRVELLPERYARCPLYLRRPPRVRTEVLEDIHLRIIRELASAPSRFAELADRTDTDEKSLGAALAALYYVGSITSNPERVWAASQQGALWSSRASLQDESAQPRSRPRDGQPSTTPLL